MKNFSYRPSNPLPPLTAVKHEWDLSTHFYTSAKDPQIEADLVAIEKAYRSFAKKYARTSFTTSAPKLAKALQDYARLEALAAGKPILYFWYRKTLNSHDTEAERYINLIAERLTKAENLVLFFPLAIGKIAKKDQSHYLKHPDLQPYRYQLTSIFTNARYTLSEAEERILNLKSLPARGLWISGTEKILNKRTVRFQGKTIPLMEAIEQCSAITPSKRPALWEKVTAELKACSEIAENELNAIIIDKKISDELRGYTTPYHAKVLANENTLESVEALVKTISQEGFALSRKFYKLKAKAHGKETLPYVSRYDPLGSEPAIPFASAVEICREVFYSVKPEYGSFFDDMLQTGRIDVYPKPGRSGGAFMSSDTGTPIMVFLNHTNTFKSLETLAHEMGHALHSYRSKDAQPPRYQDYSTTTAETASTLFENLVFDAVYQQADVATKRTLLHDRIGRDIATIQRQIAFFTYEHTIHTIVRTEGAITKERLAQEFQKQLRAYLGPAITVSEEDGYSYVYVGHFRSMFYVYTYAYGLLMSNLMAARFQHDRSYIAEIDTFLQSGGCDTVENIFAAVGINARSIKTFEESLGTLKTQIREFGRLVT